MLMRALLEGKAIIAAAIILATPAAAQDSLLTLSCTQEQGLC
jgi:hypothetical protein